MEIPTWTPLPWVPRAARARNGAGLQRGLRFLGCKCLSAAWGLLGMGAWKRGRPPWRLKASSSSCIKPRRWVLPGRCRHMRVDGGGHGPVQDISGPRGLRRALSFAFLQVKFGRVLVWKGLCRLQVFPTACGAFKIQWEPVTQHVVDKQKSRKKQN